LELQVPKPSGLGGPASRRGRGPAEPGRIVGVKNLSLAEEYLADHFPAYPVLPGVLMLEGLVQTAAWLVRASTDFEKSLILLREARNVRYGSFVRPGSQLVMEVEASEIGREESRFKAVGRCEGQTAVQAQMVLEHLNVGDEDPGRSDLDAPLRDFWRERFRLIGGPQAMAAGRQASAGLPASRRGRGPSQGGS
ncbi:MAG TPA: 3-hydroxyacyl-ACP dehydratase FabZ family protein, partial [Phycisphaerae bacterium]|nr:3-hydroxyacyl-ACP dehydratase FabZ family protein [Phycisphaerae bacterium]